MIQICLALADWWLVNRSNLEIVRDIELPDRLFQFAIVLIECRSAAPIAIGIGHDLGEYIGRLYRQALLRAPLQTDNSGVVCAVAAMIAAASVGVHTRILWERTKRSANRCAATPAGLLNRAGCESERRIRNLNAGRNCCRSRYQTIHQCLSVLRQVLWIHLV